MKFVVIDFPDAHVPASDARALHLHDRRKRLGESTFTAISFFDGDDQVATVAGRADIVDLERSRRNGRFINLITALSHGHFGVSVGDAADNRRIVSQL